MQLETLAELYPDAPNIRGWVEIYHENLHVDGHYSTSELKSIVDFAERVNRDFTNWYNKLRQFDPELWESPANIFWHDFCMGKTPAESYKENGQLYGRN